MWLFIHISLGNISINKLASALPGANCGSHWCEGSCPLGLSMPSLFSRQQLAERSHLININVTQMPLLHYDLRSRKGIGEQLADSTHVTHKIQKDPPMAGEQKKSLTFALSKFHQLTLVPSLFYISMNKFRVTITLSVECTVFSSRGLQRCAAKQLVFIH